MIWLTFDNLPFRLLLFAILSQIARFDTTHLSTLQSAQSASSPVESKNSTENLILNAEERHQRLVKVRMRSLDNSSQLRYKPINNKFHKNGGAKLTKPITNRVTGELRVNSQPKKKLRQEENNSSERIKAIVKRPKPDAKFKKNQIHSSGTDQRLPPSRLYLLLDHEAKQVKSSTQIMRTTMQPHIFRLRVPTNTTNPVDNHYGVRSRLIVDVDDELESSGFNALDELDNRVVPFVPRTDHKWHLRPEERGGKSKLIGPANKRQVLHRGENAI
ncbi:hypothetical protein M3Y97_00766000 [Aphelenchoides bicaudatus]|nr:hypothetical protein M3Y97_00766000 [Aphelenchoides bicaudatus]